MAVFTSESDSNTIAGEEQRDLLHYFFSLTTDISESKKPRVAVALRNFKDDSFPVRVPFFYFWLSVDPLWTPGNGCSEGRRPIANVGVHS